MRTLLGPIAFFALSFQCSSTTATPPVGGEGCTKDLDCKGSRVCRAGQCVDDGSVDAGSSVASDGGADALLGIDSSVDAGPPDPLEGCTPVTLTTAPYPTVVQFVVDGSGSMDSDHKWEAAHAGLEAFFQELHNAARADLAVGMLIFSDTNDPSNGDGPYPGAIDVPPGVVDTAHAAALHTRLTTTPSGGTPTRLAMQGGSTVVNNYPASGALAGARRGVVLLSDGAPSGGTTEQNQCIQGANLVRLQPTPIRTYAVGIGEFPSPTTTIYDPAFMSDLALAGGTGASSQCQSKATLEKDLCHDQITPSHYAVPAMTQRFVQALRRSVLASSRCELKITSGAAIDDTRVKITMNDGNGNTTLATAVGGTDGWSFDDAANPTVLRLGPSSCTEIGAAASIVVQACPP